MAEIETNPAILDLLSMWKEDAKIDKDEPSDELAKIGSFHAKYLHLLSINRQSVKAIEKTQRKMKKIKWEYYSGRMDAERLKKLGWEPFPYILKSDISTYMDADKDMMAIEAQKEVHEEIVDICTSIIKELTSRTYQLKDIITWTRFTSGA
jgi:hypothetical protein